MAVGTGSANIVDIVIRARDQTKAAFASAKAGIAATKTSTGSLTKGLTSLNKGFTTIGTKVSGFGTKLRGLLTSAIGPLIGVAGIAGIVIGLNKAVKAFGSFEQAAANAASVTGKTGAAFLETKKHIMDVSKVLGETTVFKASEAADAFYDLASAGYDVANITKNELKPILDLAAASQTDLKATTELVTSTLGQFSMGIESSKKVADIFARTIGSSKATMEKLGISMTYVGPVADALGHSLEETSASLGVLYNMGFDASMAGTALRGALSRLMNPTAQIEAKLSELGVTVAEVNPETHSMADILDTLTSAGMGAADTMEIFGLRAGPAILKLAGNTDKIRELTTTLNEAGGAAETMAGLTLTTFEGQMKLIHSKIEAFMLNIGEMTAPAVLAMANALTDHILPALETLYTEISTGFGEAFESIARQAGPTLEPLIKTINETSDKMSAGFDFKTLADDVGVFIGAAMNPLIRAFTWHIDKLGPLWDLIGRGADIFHNLANALKTEEGRLDDIRDATEGVNAAKQILYDINKKLKEATKTLADELRDAGGWTETLTKLETDAKTKTDALSDARKKATEAIAEHGADSEIARAAIEAVKIAEEDAKTATENYNTALGDSSQKVIDAGVATEGLQKAHVDLDTATTDSTKAQGNLETAISDLAREIEESKQAPLDLGEAFSDFGANVKKIFMAIPLHVAESFIKLNSIVADILDDVGESITSFGNSLPNFLGDSIEALGQSFSKVSDNFDEAAEEIKAKTKEIRDSLEENIEKPLTDDISEAAKETEEAIDAAMEATVSGTEEAGKGVDELKDKIGETGTEADIAGEKAEDAFSGIEVQVGDTTVKIDGLNENLIDSVDKFEDMGDAAASLTNINWSVFTEFEASLPRIQSGLGDLESSFVGFKDILEEDIDALENVKQAVMDINEIAAPFLEAGFLEGIKAIGKFAGALKDAGSAINDFSSLQDVSIEGCINFSLHVHDMVSALGILKDQMGDLEPLFGSLNSLIGDITEIFVYSGDKITDFATGFSDYTKELISDFDDMGFGISDSTKAFNAYFDAIDLRKAKTDEWLAMTPTQKAFLDFGDFVGPAAHNVLNDALETIDFIKGNFQDINDLVDDMVEVGEISWISEKEFEMPKKYTRQILDRGDALKVLDEITNKYLVDNYKLSGSLASLDIENWDISITGTTEKLQKWMKTNYGITASTEELYDVLRKPPEEQQVWFEEQLHTNEAITFQWNKQTAAIEANGEKLKQLTDAMQPHLVFMRTLNELAALSTLSTEQLNTGLTAITNTLSNLGAVLSTFDLRPVMESLFGTKIPEGDLEGQFTGGFATPFVDVLKDFARPFDELIVYTTRLTSSISGLVSAFDSLADIGDSVLLDTTALAKVFKDMVKILNNLEEAFGKNGFGETLADALGDMIKSASPLTEYFQNNSAAVIKFNNTLGTFKTTITNVVDTMDLLKKMSEMTLPTVDELVAGFERAEEAVLRFDEALLTHIGHDLSARTLDWQKHTKNNVFVGITDFATDWQNYITDGMKGGFDTFEEGFAVFKDGTDTITKLVSSINSLVSAFQTLQDMPLITSEQIVAGFEKIKDTINEVNEGMKTFATEGLSDLVAYLANVAKMWTDWDAKLGESDDTFGEAVTGITSLVNAITSLIDVQTRLAALEAPSATEWKSFFDKIAEQVDQINKGMLKFGGAGISNLANDLIGVSSQWALWTAQMGTSLTTFNDASSGIGGLANSVSGLVNAFTSLAEMPVLTADAFSAGMKDMSSNITNFAKALKDNIATIEKALDAVDGAWSSHAKTMNTQVPIFTDATTNINSLAGAILSLTRSFESLKETDFEDVFTTGFKNLTNATKAFADALKNNIDGLLASLDALVNGWLKNEEETVRLMRAFITISENFIIVIGYANALQSAFNNMTAETGTLSKGFDELIGFMNGVLEGVQKIYTTDVAADLAEFVTDVGLVVDALDTLERKLDTVMDRIREKTDSTVGSIKTKILELDNMADDAFGWGANLMTSFVNGMKSMEYYQRDELSEIAQTIYDFLGVGSNTKMGALSHLTDWPRNLVSTFAEGLQKGVPDITAALSGLQLPMDNLHAPQSYLGLAGGGNTIHVDARGWNIANKEDADYTISEIERQLTRRSVI